MSDPAATVMSVGETAGTVQYEQETSARDDLELSADEHRRLTLYAQGFLGAAARRGGVPGVLRRVRAVQLDTISVLARSHELVAYARLGPVGREAVEAAYWPLAGLPPRMGGSPPARRAAPRPPSPVASRPQTFEYWA